MTLFEASAELTVLAEAVNRREMRVVLEQDGEAIAAIVPLHDLEQILNIQARRLELLASMEAMSAAFVDVPDEEVEEEIYRIIQEQRAERRAEEKLAASAISPHMQRQHLANRRF